METTAPLISFIIPVYNSAKYLERALDSLLCQNEPGFEAILVLDPSKDSSKDIILSYTRRYPFIKLIENPTRLGVQASRHEGVKAANGSYISFMDADDLLAPNAVKIISQAIKESKAPALNFSFYVLGKNSKPFPYPFGTRRARTVKGKKALAHFYNDASVRGFLWTKVFARSLFDGPIITLFEPSDLFEDIGYGFSLLTRADKVYLSDEAYYYYDKGNTLSLTSVPRKNRALGHLNAFACIRALSEKEGRKDLVKLFRRKSYRLFLSLLLDLFIDHRNGARGEGKVVLSGFHELNKKAFRGEGTMFEGLLKRAFSSLELPHKPL